MGSAQSRSAVLGIEWAAAANGIIMLGGRHGHGSLGDTPADTFLETRSGWLVAGTATSGLFWLAARSPDQTRQLLPDQPLLYRLIRGI